MNDIECFDVPHLGDPIPVVIYGRKSPDESARKRKRRGGLVVSQSVARQEAQAREWCVANGRIPLAFLYDDLTSGAQAARAGIDAVFQWAKSKQVREVVVVYFERFSRDEELGRRHTAQGDRAGSHSRGWLADDRYALPHGPKQCQSHPRAPRAGVADRG